jgi:hypothetical protein
MTRLSEEASAAAGAKESFMFARSAGRLVLACALVLSALTLALAQSTGTSAPGTRTVPPGPRHNATPRPGHGRPAQGHGATYGGVRPYVIVNPSYVNSLLAKPSPTPKPKHTPFSSDPDVFSHYDNRAQ